MGVAACGDDSEPSSSAAPGGPGLTTTTGTTPGADQTATATETAPTPTETAEAPTGTTGSTGTTTTEIGPEAGEEEEGPGDTEAARAPADFQVGAALEPSRITVPAFLTIELRATSSDGRAHTLRLTTPRGPVTLSVPPGGSASKEIEGLPEGEYLIAVDGQAGDSALVVGGEPGP